MGLRLIVAATRSAFIFHSFTKTETLSCIISCDSPSTSGNFFTKAGTSAAAMFTSSVKYCTVSCMRDASGTSSTFDCLQYPCRPHPNALTKLARLLLVACELVLDQPRRRFVPLLARVIVHGLEFRGHVWERRRAPM